MEIPDILGEFSKHVLYTTVVERIKHLIGTIGGTTKAADDIYSNCRVVTAFLRHRKTVYDKLYEKAFESGKDVLYLSIMSRETLEEMPDRLERARVAGTKIRVLTWDPAVGRKVVEAFRKHLGEHEDKTSGAYDQVCRASTAWRRLAGDFPSVITEVRQYDSAPTMQGLIVEGEWALIELMPFHMKPNERPALYLAASIDTGMFTVFDSAFNSLFKSSKPLVNSEDKSGG